MAKSKSTTTRTKSTAASRRRNQLREEKSLEAYGKGCVMSSKTLDYEAVESICNDVANLSQSVSRQCTILLGEHAETQYADLQAALMLMRNASDTIGAMADHCLGGDILGGSDAWFGLPEMGFAEGGE